MADTPVETELGPEDRPSRVVHSGPMVSIEQELRSSYLDYAMSVIVSRAIPDLRDGLKPVHRRILHAMNETGATHDKPYRKSARPVGDVMGKYHPHGDSAIYDALVRMAQDFSMSLPLLDGQGNFGSMDGDNPAAMRYTEVRMASAAAYLLADINKNTVDFQENYDGKDQEPTVLPARFPNMLVNGAGGIAVGMATNIPPHNLGEIIDATLALIADPDLSSMDIFEYVLGPDFPTGGIILGKAGARRAYLEGRGSVLIRAKTKVEEIRKDRLAIIVEEVPYQVNKATMIEKIAEGVRDKRIEGIASVEDLSDRDGIRVVIELKRDATPEVVLNQLYRFSPMQTSFACNMLALNGGRPEQLTLRGFLTAFIDFRQEVVTRRTTFDLNEARKRSHILCGLAVAVANVDEVVATIRSSSDPASAREKLMARRWPAQDIAQYIGLIDDPSHTINADNTYNLSEIQARAILDLRLQRLTQIGVADVARELEELAEKTKNFLHILSSQERIREIISDELRAVKELFAVPRRTKIGEWEADIEDEDLIESEDMVVTATAGGYIKRTALSEFREQRRGGKGLASISTKEEDVVTTLFVSNTHMPLLFFATNGIAYKLKTLRLPLGERRSKGKPIVNILPIPKEVSLAAILPVDREEEEWDTLQVVFATSKGTVRRNALSDFKSVLSNGKIAIKLDDGNELVNVQICHADDDVMLVTNKGQAQRFRVSDLRQFKNRYSVGVRGVRLKKKQRVVSMLILRHLEITTDERESYLRMRRRLVTGSEVADGAEITDEPVDAAKIVLSEDRFAEMLTTENLILTITSKGFGKLTSSHNFRITRRGGLGIRATDKAMRGGSIVASFPVELDDQVMLVTSAGQSIRVPVKGISIQSRTAGGVKVLNIREDEKVVSVARIVDQEEQVESIP
ncbi:MAG: DNA gyrase subunit A [Aestuariivita sp.]|nr:DNA gyrase subunit A [Aestuariivita sp.]MCY4203473.1 DNA gyrase subunit A [Aestuariivita sp.]